MYIFNETKRTAMKFGGLERKRRIIRSVWVILLVIFFSSVKSVYFNQFFCFLCIHTLCDVGPYQTLCRKIHYIDPELAGHVAYINLTWKGRVCVGVAFLCLLCACLPNLTTLECIDQQHFAKTKMAYISLPWDLNAITGIKSYYCVILKMVIFAWCNKNNSE